MHDRALGFVLFVTRRPLMTRREGLLADAAGGSVARFFLPVLCHSQRPVARKPFTVSFLSVKVPCSSWRLLPKRSCLNKSSHFLPLFVPLKRTGSEELIKAVPMVRRPAFVLGDPFPARKLLEEAAKKLPPASGRASFFHPPLAAVTFRRHFRSFVFAILPWTPPIPSSSTRHCAAGPVFSLMTLSLR